MKAWKREEIIRQRTNEHLENIRKHLEPSNSKNQSVGEEVEKQEQKVLMSSERAMKKEERQEEEATLSSGFLMKNEVVKNETTLEMTKEHEESQLSQISLDQNASTLESMIERYEEEMKKAWEDQQTSSMKELLKQMLSVKEEGEEQASLTGKQVQKHSSVWLDPQSRECPRFMCDSQLPESQGGHYLLASSC